MGPRDAVIWINGAFWPVNWLLTSSLKFCIAFQTKSSKRALNFTGAPLELHCRRHCREITCQALSGTQAIKWLTMLPQDYYHFPENP